MYELVNTSLPNGLISGTHGFATVAMTKGMPDVMRNRLEALCAYSHRVSSHDSSYYTQNPVNWFHVILPKGDHVVGRVAPCEFDYTGRTNRLARLLVFGSGEMPAAGAPSVFSAESSRFSEPWSGDPRYLDLDEQTPQRLRNMQPSVFATPSRWTELFGANGEKYALAFSRQLKRNIESGQKPIFFKTSAEFDPDGSRLLGLFEDLVDCLPTEMRGAATFATYPASIPTGTSCILRGVYDTDKVFSAVSSSQAWVDCVAARIVHEELLPPEEHTPAPAAPAPQISVAKPENSQPQLTPVAQPVMRQNPQLVKKPQLTVVQRPQYVPQPGVGANQYLPPPRKDHSTQIIAAVACVVVVVLGVVAALLFLKGKKGAGVSSVPVISQAGHISSSDQSAEDEEDVRQREREQKIKVQKQAKEKSREDVVIPAEPAVTNAVENAGEKAVAETPKPVPEPSGEKFFDYEVEWREVGFFKNSDAFKQDRILDAGSYDFEIVWFERGKKSRKTVIVKVDNRGVAVKGKEDGKKLEDLKKNIGNGGGFALWYCESLQKAWLEWVSPVELGTCFAGGVQTVNLREKVFPGEDGGKIYKWFTDSCQIVNYSVNGKDFETESMCIGDWADTNRIAKITAETNELNTAIGDCKKKQKVLDAAWAEFEKIYNDEKKKISSPPVVSPGAGKTDRKDPKNKQPQDKVSADNKKVVADIKKLKPAAEKVMNLCGNPEWKLGDKSEIYSVPDLEDYVYNPLKKAYDDKIKSVGDNEKKIADLKRELVEISGASAAEYSVDSIAVKNKKAAKGAGK